MRRHRRRAIREKKPRRRPVAARSGAGGHALQHANKLRHWLAASCSGPYATFCFKCDKDESIKVLKEQTARAIPVKGDAGSRVFGSDNGHGNPVRRILNRGKTCYVNALVQCLLALEHIRVWMLGQNAPTSPIDMALKELFVPANSAGCELKPDKLLARIHSSYLRFQRRSR
uniref:Uncharacterized protein n=1 Tax=Arundo donax TaxID=35708 RepID=A0A0A9SDR1_ARUDO